jgi:hypothetical protein
MCESQEAELELAEAAFGSSFQVVNINENETVFSLQMTSGVTLTFTIHVDYPKLPLKCSVHGAIANSKRESISQDIQKMLEDCPGLGGSLLLDSLTMNRCAFDLPGSARSFGMQ